MKRIRDHMDDILEAKGYYRKRVAQEEDSLFRAVADLRFHSQTQAHILKIAVKAFIVDLEQKAEEDEGAQLFGNSNVCLDVICVPDIDLV